MTRLFLSLTLAALVLSGCQLQKQTAPADSTLFERKKECATICAEIHAQNVANAQPGDSHFPPQFAYNPALDTCLYKVTTSLTWGDTTEIESSVEDCLTRELLLTWTTISLPPAGARVATQEEFETRADLLMQGLAPNR